MVGRHLHEAEIELRSLRLARATMPHSVSIEMADARSQSGGGTGEVARTGISPQAMSGRPYTRSGVAG